MYLVVVDLVLLILVRALCYLYFGLFLLFLSCSLLSSRAIYPP